MHWKRDGETLRARGAERRDAGREHRCRQRPLRPGGTRQWELCPSTCEMQPTPSPEPGPGLQSMVMARPRWSGLPSVCCTEYREAEEKPWEKLLGREGQWEERPKQQMLRLQPRTFHTNARIWMSCVVCARVRVHAWDWSTCLRSVNLSLCITSLLRLLHNNPSAFPLVCSRQGKGLLYHSL